MLVYALVAGVLFGLYFSLVGIGLNLVFGVMRIVNLAHGDFLMLGAFVAFGVVTLAGIDPLFAVPLAFVIFLLVGMLLYWVLVPRLQGSANPEMLSIILFFGLSQVIEAVTTIFFGTSERSIQSRLLGTVFSTIRVKLFGGKPDAAGPIQIFGQGFPAPWVIAAVTSLIAIALVYLYLYRTRLGTLTRAVMSRRDEAMATGIDVDRVSAAAFGIGLGLAAVAGVFAPFMFGSVTPAFGADATVTSFAIVVLGSLGNPFGTALGGMVYGVCYMLVQTYLSSWADLSALRAPDLHPAAASERPARKAGARCLDALKHTLFIVVPLLAVFAVLPGVYQNHLLLFNFVIFLMLAQGVNIIYGFTGYLPFGYVGFFGAGAYGFAIMVMHYQTPAVVAVMVCGPGRGGARAVADTAVAAVRRLFRHRQSRGIAGGAALRRQSGAGEHHARALRRLAHRHLQPDHGLYRRAGRAGADAGAVVFLKNSRFGLALQAVREDAVCASMAGVDVVRMRVIAWLASALVAGLAGGVYAWYVSVFYPDNVFSGDFRIFAIVFALFGGVATITGPIVGVMILYGIYNLIGFTTPQYFQLIYGLLIMGLVLFLPAGLVSLATRRGWHVP